MPRAQTSSRGRGGWLKSAAVYLGLATWLTFYPKSRHPLPFLDSAADGVVGAAGLFFTLEIARLLGPHWWRRGPLRNQILSQFAVIFLFAILFVIYFPQHQWEGGGLVLERLEAVTSVALDLLWWNSARRAARAKRGQSYAK